MGLQAVNKQIPMQAKLTTTAIPGRSDIPVAPSSSGQDTIQRMRATGKMGFAVGEGIELRVQPLSGRAYTGIAAFRARPPARGPAIASTGCGEDAPGSARPTLPSEVVEQGLATTPERSHQRRGRTLNLTLSL